MAITSITFLGFLLISVIIYYIFPRKFRWFSLLITSIFFFLSASSYKMLLYLAFGITATYIGTRLIDEKIKSEKAKKLVLFITLICIIGELSILKYINIIPNTINGIGKIFAVNWGLKTFSLIAPLGISYYTLSLIGYTVDVYRTTSHAQKNLLKHALFTCYYPAMISGPITRYNEMKHELFEGNKYNFNNIISGIERIIYGLMKKMVIADQVAIVIKVIFDGYQEYSGLFIIVGVIFYAIQIYADFSGCIDIVLGASKMYGVTLPENFESPFYSKTLSEFWRRWHITLGNWAKDYIMYPLLKSKHFQKLGTFTKRKLGKKLGKKIPTILAIFILWVIIGIWHGASYKYIFAAGILPWLYLTFNELFGEVFEKLSIKLNINKETFSYKIFCGLRTFALMCIIWLFARSSSFLNSFDVIRHLFIWGNIDLRMNLPQIPYHIIIFACCMVMIVDYLKYKNINVLEKFNEQNLLFKYIAIFGMIYLILIYGAYGPGYNPVDFIYGGF